MYLTFTVDVINPCVIHLATSVVTGWDLHKSHFQVFARCQDLYHPLRPAVTKQLPGMLKRAAITCNIASQWLLMSWRFYDVTSITTTPLTLTSSRPTVTL